MQRFRWIALVAVGLLVSLASAQMPPNTDEQTLRSSKLPADTEGLIQFFRQRSLKEGDAKVLEELVHQLGSEVYRIREPAAKQVVLRGPVALPFLKAALVNSPLEMKRRAENCIRDIEALMQSEPVAAAARVLAQRKDPRAAEVLFNFLPSISDDPFLEEEILASVGRLTIQPGKVDPLILKALDDPLSFRRAVAAYLLGRRGDREYRAPLRKLLADPDPLVARRVGQGLIGKRPGHALDEALASDQNLLRGEKIDLTEKAVCEFFHKRTLSAADQQRLRSLVKDMGATVYAVRENATRQLVKEGSPALPFLAAAEFDENVERSRRARDCLSTIRQKTSTALPIAAAHWLAAANKKAAPAEAIKTLLAYVPFADDDAVEDEVLTCLTLLSLRETAIDPALRQALHDRLPARRAAAAYVLGHVGTKDDLVLVQEALDDVHSVVRLRAAQGMLAARDKAALPCLVQLVQQVPAPYFGRVEEALTRLSDDAGPTEAVIVSSLDSRQKASKAWEKWLDGNLAKIDLSSLADRDAYLGLITICEYDNRMGNVGGQVWETNRGNQKRWGFTGVMGAMDAHTLPNGRVLVAENSSLRVTERDVRGDIKWEYRLPNNYNPICCQRLPNGNTFIASYNMVMEVTPAKQEVYRYTPGPQFYIFSAHKAKNGAIIAITAQGQIIEMDSKTGQQKNSVSANSLGNWCSVELQPNGNYLVARMNTNSVCEIDRTGKEVWSQPFPGAFRATRLPNGNVLVASMSTREVAEMDRSGTIRWRTTCLGRPWSVHYR